MKKFAKLFLLTILSCILFAIAVACSTKKEKPLENLPTEPTIELPEVHEDTNFKDIYSLNDEIFMNYLLMDIDGSKYRITEGELEYPNGKTYKKTAFKLSEVGRYTLSYTAKLNDDVKTGVKDFDVLGGYYSVASEYSKVEFGENIPYTIFTNGTYDKNGTPVTAWAGGLDCAYATGLKVSLAEGDVFSWQKPLKLDDGLNDLFNIILPQATPYYRFPELKGVPKQADRIVATLTDCYDSNKTLEIVFDFSRNLGYLCVRTGVNGDVASSLSAVNRNSAGQDTGFSSEKPKKYFFIDGKEYVCIYGTRGTQLNAMETGGYTLSIDTNNAEVFIASSEMVEKGNKLLINTLNNFDIHEDISKHFTGFTNNEAYLSIKCEGYYDSTCDFILTNILNSSQDDFKVEKYVDDVKPLLNINTNLDTIGVVCGKDINLFDAECFDVNLKGDYKVKCYYGYGTENQTTIKIVDNKLNLPIAGKYSLVYTAYDVYGNKTDKVITLNAKNSGEMFSYSKNKLSDVRLGEQVELPQINPIGLNGEVSVSASVTAENGTPVEIESGKFMCLNAGKYLIKYAMTDGIYSEDFAYEINGLPNENNVQFLDNLVLEKYLMQGRNYYFDNYYAYTFENATPTAHIADVYANVDGGGFTKIDNYNNYLVTANNALQFKFAYKGSEIVTDEIKIVNVGLNNESETIDIQNYFITDDNAVVTKNKTDEFVKINVNRDSTVEFINPISFKSFATRFNIPQELSGFGKLSFILTDFYDRTKSIQIKFVNDGSSKLIVGNKSVAINSFIGNALNLEYKNKSIQSDTAVIGVDNVFTLDKVMLSIVFENVKSNVELQLFKLNGQSFNVTEDNVYPDICVENVSGRYNVGSTITIFKPYLSDVFSSIHNAQTMVTVQTVGGVYLKDINGNELKKFVINEDIQVKFDSIGKAYVTYFAEDTAGNQLNKGRGLRYTLDIVDATAPEIELESGYNKFVVKPAKLNDTVKIASYTVKDDCCPIEQLKVSVRIFSPYNELYVLDKDTFVASRVGSYRVVYSCIDASGNMSETYYTIEVK